jgi:hypothetical protein
VAAQGVFLRRVFNAAELTFRRRNSFNETEK